MTPALLNESEAAEYLSVSISLLRKWRQSHTGPAVTRLGSLVRYTQASLDAWISERTETRQHLAPLPRRVQKRKAS